MLAVLLQMWLYICHECMLLCSIFCQFLNFELSDGFVIWQFLFFYNFFSASPWSFSRVSQAQSQLTLSCVSDSPCHEWEVKVDDLQGFFPTIISVIHHVLVIHFLCITGVLNLICLLWPLNEFVMEQEVISCGSTADWDLKRHKLLLVTGSATFTWHVLLVKIWVLA